jgi:hypothetical protein
VAAIGPMRATTPDESLFPFFHEDKQSITKIADFSRLSIPFGEIIRNITVRHSKEAHQFAIVNVE